MNPSSPLSIDFFHDVVCCWCFNLSSRLRTLAEEFALDIQHRTFVLQDSPAEMRRRWGTPEQARASILEHWSACRRVSDRPHDIDIAAMQGARFDYPHGLPAALACKAAEHIGGQRAHWDLFDRLQQAHLAQARDVADPTELVALASEIGLDADHMRQALSDPRVRAGVDADRQLARALQVNTIPALVVRGTGQRLANGSLHVLCGQLKALQALQAATQGHQPVLTSATP